MSDQDMLDRYAYQQSEKGAKVQSKLDEMAKEYSAIVGKKVKSGRIECLKSEKSNKKYLYEK